MIDPAGSDDFMGQREHQRGVGSGTDLQPLMRRQLFTGIMNRTDADDLDAASTCLRQPVGGGVIAEAAGGDLCIGQVDAAEEDDHPRVVEDCRPLGRLAAEENAIVAHHMRTDDLSRREGVGLLLVDKTADGVEETLEMGGGVMEASGRSPAVGAGKNSLVALFGNGRLEFPLETIVGGLPIDLDELALAPVGAVTFEPFLAYGGLEHARRRMDCFRQAADQRRGIPVADKRIGGLDPSRLGGDMREAPVGRRNIGHSVLSPPAGVCSAPAFSRQAQTGDCRVVTRGKV